MGTGGSRRCRSRIHPNVSGYRGRVPPSFPRCCLDLLAGSKGYNFPGSARAVSLGARHLPKTSGVIGTLRSSLLGT